MQTEASPRAPSGSGAVVPVLLCLIVLALLYLGVLRPGWQRERRAKNESSAAAAVHYLYRLEDAIKTHDLDGNGAADYWTGDVEGMAALIPGSGPAADFLASSGYREVAASLREVVQADPSRSDAKPYRGYWIVPLDQDADGQPLRQQGRPHHPSSFGYCAYPADLGVTGSSTFLIHELGTVFKSPTGLRTTRIPTDSELRIGWSKVG